MAWKLSNFAESTLQQYLAAGATTIYIDADEVDLLPTLAVGDKAKAVLFNSSQREIVNITAWNTDGTVTVERAQEGTGDYNWESGTRFIHTPTAELLEFVTNALAEIGEFGGTATYAAGNYEVTIDAAVSVPTPSDGDTVQFVIPTTNTGAATVSFTNGTDTLAAAAIKHLSNDALQAGDFAAGYLATLQYVAAWTSWVVLSKTSLHAEIDQLNDGPVPAICRHPNPRLDHWSAGTSFSTPTTEAEVANGWFVEYDGTIGTFTVSQQTFTLGQTDVPGNPKYFLRWAHTAAGSGSTKRILKVKIPGVHWRAGETAIRRLWIKGASAHNITATVRQNFGTGGSPSAEVTAASEVLVGTTSWTAYDIEVTLPSLAGKTLGTAGDDCIVLALELPVNVTMTLDFAMDDFRQGELAGQPLSDQFPVPLFHGGLGRAFQPPAGDRILFYDLSGTYFEYLSLPVAGIAISGTALVLANDLEALEALGSTGIAVRTGSDAWAQRQVVAPTGMGVTNPAGVAGDITLTFGTALTNYVADPLSAAELASVTAPFGTAAFANIGTSGDAVGKLNAANTYSAAQTYNGGFTLAASQVASIAAGALLAFDGGSALKDYKIGVDSVGVFVTRYDATGVTPEFSYYIARADGTATIGGNVAMHAGNVATYALPIGGGTLTGTVTHGPAVNVFGNLWSNSTTTHQMAVLFPTGGTEWLFRPRPSGTSDTAKEFGFDFTNLRWFFDANLRVGGTLSDSSGVTFISSINGLSYPGDSIVDLANDIFPFYDASVSGNAKGLGLAVRQPAPDIVVEHQLASGTAGGTFTSGAWQTRPLNTEVRDVRNECSLASNQVELTAGTYYAEWWAQGRQCILHQTRLYNVTDTSLLGTGSNEDIADDSTTSSLGSCTFTVAASKKIELQHRCSTTSGTNGFGSATSWGTEVYANLSLWRLS